jgi:hypothetical protein
MLLILTVAAGLWLYRNLIIEKRIIRQLVNERLGVTQLKGKKVYILASHSHFFEEYIYDTPEHGGHELPGWIIGTAGAEQYRPDIRYGYLLVEVTPDGVIHNSFKEVYRDSSPEGPAELTRYCFEQNRQTSRKPEDFVTAAKCSSLASSR